MRGLLVIEPLYHQIVSGNKTQTRRSGGLEAVNKSPDEHDINGYGITYPDYHIGEVSFCKKSDGFIKGHITPIICKPRYRVGDVLYLKEPFVRVLTNSLTPNGYMYKFGVPDGFVGNYFRRQIGSNNLAKWPNKLFMPASAARAFIRITGIKCERLLDISDEDCIAEGVERIDDGYKYIMMANLVTKCETPQLAFKSIYRAANKIKDVDIPNIWVWAYEFEYLKDYKL